MKFLWAVMLIIFYITGEFCSKNFVPTLCTTRLYTYIFMKQTSMLAIFMITPLSLRTSLCSQHNTKKTDANMLWTHQLKRICIKQSQPCKLTKADLRRYNSTMYWLRLPSSLQNVLYNFTRYIIRTIFHL